MRVYNRYVITLLLVLGAANVLLAAVGQTGLDVYLVVSAIAYLVVSLLFVYLNPRARGLLGAIGFVLLAVVLVVAGIKAAEVLGWK